MKHILLILILCYTSHLSYSAFERQTQGSRAVALGGAPVALAGNEWSAFTNPACFRNVPERTLSVSYVPQLFEVDDLSQAALSYVEPTPVGTFAFSASRFGFDLYKETQLALSFSELISSSFTAGVTVNHYSLSIRNYGSASAFGIDVGLLAEISDGIQWGVSAVNVTSAKIGEAKEELPQVFRTGLSYSPVQSGMILLSVEKDMRYPATLHLGIEYELIDMIALRGGSCADPDLMNLGIGVQTSFAQLDYAFTSHAQLGVTHSLSLSIKLNALL